MKKTPAGIVPPKVHEPRGVPLTLSLLMGGTVFMLLPISQWVEAARPPAELPPQSDLYFPPDEVVIEDVKEDPKPIVEDIEPPRIPPIPPSITDIESLLRPDASGFFTNSVGDIFSPSLRDDILDILDSVDLDQQPQPIVRTQPVYPLVFVKSKIQGMVVVEFVVNKDGSVSSPRILKSSHPEFSKSVLDALRKWKFEPGMKDGVAVNARVRQPIPFQIQ